MFKLKAFLLILAGQVVYILGSTLSGFALGIWLYQTTGSASNFALTALCSVLPRLLVSPLAGGLVGELDALDIGDPGIRHLHRHHHLVHLGRPERLETTVHSTANAHGERTR